MNTNINLTTPTWLIYVFKFIRKYIFIYIIDHNIIFFLKMLKTKKINFIKNTLSIQKNLNFWLLIEI